MKPAFKKILLQFNLLLFVFTLFVNASGQTRGSLSRVYLQTGAGISTHKGGDAGIAIKTIFRENWSFSFGFQNIEMDPKNLPSDYQPETGYIIFIPYTYKVSTTMDLFSLTAGKSFQLRKNIWATLEAGPSFVRGEKVNFEKTQSTTTFIFFAATVSSNYNTTKENKSTVGAMLQGDINWAFGSFIGVSAGIYANLNSVQSPLGLNIKLLLGKMGRRR